MARVLHVVETLDRFAVETWLLRMLAHARRRGADLDWTFYCTLPTPGACEAAALALGASVIRTPVPLASKRAFAGALRGELKRGRYDVLHGHHDLVSGLYLAAALGLPIRRRIVHVHNLDESVLTPSRLKRAVLRPALRRTCLALADTVVANSSHALEAFLAGRRPRPGRDRVHLYGIDPSPFETPAAIDRPAFRASLGLPADTPILLFAGRMTPEKNPVFVVDVLAALRHHLPKAVAVFAGVGDLESRVLGRAGVLAQRDAVRLLGWRSDVAELMKVSDWFILPRPHTPMEGFGIAVVEAQLAGLRLLLSRGVGDAPLLPGAARRRLSLGVGAQAWAAAALELWRIPPQPAEIARQNFDASPMQMDRALEDLLALHV